MIKTRSKCSKVPLNPQKKDQEEEEATATLQKMAADKQIWEAFVH